MPRRRPALPVRRTAAEGAGLRNWSADLHGASAAHAGFVEVLGLLDSLRHLGLLGFGFQTKNDVQTADLLINDRPHTPRDARVRRLVELLGLDPAARSFPLSSVSATARATRSRSTPDRCSRS